MKCGMIRDLLQSYIDGLTSEESNQEIEKHLESCETCRNYLDLLKKDMISEPYVRSREEIKEEIKPFKKYSERTIITVIAAIAIIIGLGSFTVTVFSILAEHNYVAVKEDYQGPNFPLTAISDTEGIVAERRIRCDYSEYKYTLEGSDRTVDIQDEYILKNTTEEDIVLKLAYGFAGYYRTSGIQVPRIKIDDQKVDSELVLGRTSLRYIDLEKYQGYRVEDIRRTIYSRESFEELLADGVYQREAFEAEANVPEFPENAKIYKFEDLGCKPGEGELTEDDYSPAAKIFIEYDPEKTEVYHFGMLTCKEEDGQVVMTFGIPMENSGGYGKDDVYIVVVGDDIKIQDLKCYRNIQDKKEAEKFTKVFREQVKLVEYESSLEEVLEEIADVHRFDGGWLPDSQVYLEEMLTKEQLLHVGKQFIADMREINHNGQLAHRLETYLEPAYGDYRVIYQTAEVTIPANESIVVTVEYEKYTGIKKFKKEECDGLEIMTTLDSSLEFTSQTLEVAGIEDLTISEHTTGEVLEGGQNIIELKEDCFEIYLEVPKMKINQRR